MTTFSFLAEVAVSSDPGAHFIEFNAECEDVWISAEVGYLGTVTAGWGDVIICNNVSALSEMSVLSAEICDTPG